MTVLDGVRVTASNHATDQALRRVATLRGADRYGSSRWVERSAARAILAGRSARTVPRWCSVGKTRLPRRGKLGPGELGFARFVWNEAETAVFLVKRLRESRGGGWLVLTVMVPARPEFPVS